MLMMKKIQFLVVLVAAVALSGCASILSRRDYPVTVTSSPEGAELVIYDKKGKSVFKGKAPTTVTLSASSGAYSGAKYRLEFTAPGHKPTTTYLTAGLDGWYIGNILFGGLVGILIVDPLTGAMFSLKDSIHGTLQPEDAKSSSIMSNGKLKVVSIDTIPDEWKDNLVQVN